MKSEFKGFSVICFLLSVFCLLFSGTGCDAFVRKFTRKPKKQDIPQQEMVLEPETYNTNLSKEELYRQYFLFWKSWQDELIEALLRSGNHKKQVSCIREAVKNLVQVRMLLNPEKQKKLDVYLGQMQGLQDAILEDTYGADSSINRLTADRLKMRILKEFSYPRIKDSLV